MDGKLSVATMARMSVQGRSSSLALRQHVDDDLRERMEFLHELVEEVAGFPGSLAPRTALRHRLLTLETTAQDAGRFSLAEQAKQARDCLRSITEPDLRESDLNSTVVAGRFDKLRALIAEMPRLLVIYEPEDTRPPPKGDADHVEERLDARKSGPMPKGFNDVFFEGATLESQLQIDVATMPPPRPIELTQTVSGVVPAPNLVNVLVVDDPACVDRVRAGLPHGSYEVQGTSDPEQALALLRAHRCTVVMIAQSVVEDPAIRLVERIRSDDVAQERRVLLLSPRGSQAMAARLGCDAWVRTPVEPLLLDALLERVLGRGAPRPSPLQELTEGTVDDITQRLTEEIRRGLTEALQVGRDERIAIQDSQELVAAAWSAIGRVRTHLSQRSMGKVRFADQGHSLLDATGPQAAELVDAGIAADTRLLVGQRMVVADDDPAVLWFFAGLLREAGALVWEAKNGREALELAHRHQPQLVISDILMPKLDGFALCREFRRDVALWDVPIVLLSWKEDFLFRMRELQSGAAGYLRKEAGSREILGTVADMLRPRARLGARLATEDVVSGRVDKYSVLTLMQLAAAERGDVAIKIQDAYSLYEIQIRGGDQISITRTTADGSFARGELALRQVVGVRSGHFEVNPASGTLRAALELPLAEALTAAISEMSALVEAVSGAQLLRIASVQFDQELLAALADVLPATAAEVLGYASDVESTLRDHIISGDLSPHVAEEQLVELARAGVIVAVSSVDGENLVAEALAEFSDRFSRNSASGDLDQALENEAIDSSAQSRPADSAESVDLASEAGARPRRETEVLSMSVHSEVGDEPASADFATSSSELAHPSPEPLPAGGASTSGVAPTPIEAMVQPEIHVPARSARLGVGPEIASKVSVVLTMAALAALGYAAVRMLSPQIWTEPPNVAQSSATTSSQSSELTVDRQAATDPERLPGKAASMLVDKPTELGRVLPFIDHSRGVDVAENEGLLVIDCDQCAGETSVRIGKRSPAKVPIALALPEGRHELVLTYDGRTRFRYLEMRRGQTRVVDVP